MSEQPDPQSPSPGQGAGSADEASGQTRTTRRASARKRKSTLPADAPEVVSPCISICQMDQATGVCKGCYRTLEEIATWGRLDNQQRWDIVQSLRDRRRSLYPD